MVPALIVAILATRTAEPDVQPLFDGKEPQIATSGSNVYLAYGQGDNIYVANSVDQSQNFATVATLGFTGKIALGMRRGPRIAASGSRVVVTVVSGKLGGGKDGDVVAFSSSDNGKIWTGSTLVSDVPGSASEGLQGLAASKSGLFASVWLDHRNGSAEIWASTSKDGKFWSKNVLVYRSPDGHVCECCHPSAAFGPNGELYVMFRNWLGGSRDMYVSTSLDNGKSFRPAVKLGQGTWPLNSCPMDGGTIAVTDSGIVQTAWRRNQSVFLDTLNQSESKLASGTQPWIAANGNQTGVVWLQDGKVMTKTPATQTTELGSGRDPVIAPMGNRFLAAWADDKRVWIARIQ